MTDYERNLEVFDEWTSLGGVFVKFAGGVVVVLPDLGHSVALRLDSFYEGGGDFTCHRAWRLSPSYSLPRLKQEIARGNAVQVRREDVKGFDMSLCSKGVKKDDKFLSAKEYVEQLREEGDECQSTRRRSAKVFFSFECPQF